MIKRLIVIFLLTVPAFSQLIRPGFLPIHDNLQPMRQLEMNKCFEDGQIPCRWVSNMGLGYGYPLFNYYPPFPYYLGQIYHLVGFSYLDITKALVVSGFIVSAFGMYLLSSRVWGRTGGLISSLLYTYAPYHSVDFYVRGAVNEFWAMAFLPLIFFLSMHLVQTSKKTLIPVLSLSLTGLMLSHNAILLITAPFLIIWSLFWVFKQRSSKGLCLLAASAILALGLSAFFTIPVILEQNLVHVETLMMGYFNYTVHFLDIKQIFLNINWGYGGSAYGPNDGLSFALGYLHWIIPLIIACLLLFMSNLRKNIILTGLLFGFLVCSLALTHSRSIGIWDHLPQLQFIQFPWRFLTLAVFFSSLLCGAIGLTFLRRFWWVLAVLIMLLNAQYFMPQIWLSDTTDAQTFSGESWQKLISASIFDYLPKSAPRPPATPAQSDLLIIGGAGNFITLVKNSHFQKYNLYLSAPSVIQIQTYYFAGWKVYVDNQLVSISTDSELGRMEVNVSAGQHVVEVKFEDTLIRNISDTVSLISWSILTLFYLITLTKWSKKVLFPQL